MPRRPARHSRHARIAAGLGAVLVPAGLLAAPAPAAQAVTGRPPVTAPDVARPVFPGNATFATPLANDTDPDGDELAVCRLGEERYRGLETGFDGDEFVVFTGPRAKPGTYTFTYYACDFSYLVPGTVTVTVEAAPKVKVKAIEARPGYVEVTNPADFAVRVLYGSFKEDEPDGSVLVGSGRSAVVRVHREVLDYIVLDRRGARFITQGKVRGIELPSGDGPQDAPRTVTPRGTTWAPRG